MAVHVITADWETRSTQLRAVRHVVFVDEQQVPEELEWDDADAQSQHFLALDSSGQVLGCARLTAAGQIGRMAVLKEQRGKGIGAQLLAAAIATGQEQGHDRLFLHAQTQAEGFYRGAGFLQDGEPFMEAGIAHIPMAMVLPIAFDPGSTAAASSGKRESHPPSATRTSNKTSTQEAASNPLTPTSFSSEMDARTVLVECLMLAKRRLLLFSPYLDPSLFDQADVCEPLSAFARSSSNAQLRILIYSSKQLVTRTHALGDLARRLDDKIAIRVVPEEYARDERSFVVWDQVGYWLLPASDDYQGLATGHDPVAANRLSERFDYLWEKSRPDPQLRTLKL